ncbi:TIGR03752 family integrating conjugative element protein [Vibrio tritonius]|uniref:TIGR03752 family integrating conjugative element protein n=1 Tax=Vibrio tritonius TaxID=1435069 RepID=UPI00315C6B38
MNGLVKLTACAAILVGGPYIYLHLSDKSSAANDTSDISQRMAQADQQLSGEKKTPLASTPDYNATLKTLIAKQNQSQSKYDNLTQSNNELRNEVANLKAQIDAVKTNGGNSSSEESSANKAMEKRLAELDERLKQYTSNAKNSIQSLGIGKGAKPTRTVTTVPHTSTGNSDKNNLLDILKQPGSNDYNGNVSENTPDANSISTDQNTTSDANNQAYIWLEPQDVMLEHEKGEKNGKLIKTYPSIGTTDAQTSTEQNDVKPTKDTANTQLSTGPIPVTGMNSAATTTASTSVPIYNIPALSTLMDVVNMTSIIARIPTDNKVVNAFRFKVIVSAENLASNGFYIPQISQMTLEGNSQGDFTMKCARGTIDKALFIFKDGSIASITNGASGEGKDGGSSSGLGYISDEYGNPCIDGKYISNFNSFVKTQAGLSALSSFASSVATAATSTTDSDTTGVTKTTVNNALQKGLGDGASTGVDTVSDFYAKRQSSAFDAVFVPAGEKLEIHVEQDLTVNYTPKGQKLVNEGNVEKYLQ